MYVPAAIYIKNFLNPRTLETLRQLDQKFLEFKNFHHRLQDHGLMVDGFISATRPLVFGCEAEEDCSSREKQSKTVERERKGRR